MATLSHVIGHEIAGQDPLHPIRRAAAVLRQAWAAMAVRIAEERRDRALRRDLDRLNAHLLRDIGYDV